MDIAESDSPHWVMISNQVWHGLLSLDLSEADGQTKWGTICGKALTKEQGEKFSMMKVLLSPSGRVKVLGQPPKDIEGVDIMSLMGRLVSMVQTKEDE